LVCLLLYQLWYIVKMVSMNVQPKFYWCALFNVMYHTQKNAWTKLEAKQWKLPPNSKPKANILKSHPMYNFKFNLCMPRSMGTNYKDTNLHGGASWIVSTIFYKMRHLKMQGLAPTSFLIPSNDHHENQLGIWLALNYSL